MTTRADQDALVASLLPSEAGAISAADIRAVFDSAENGSMWAITGSGAPSTAPERVGDGYIDTSTTPNTVYLAFGTSSASDYKSVATLTTTQTLTNKTLTEPRITTILDANGNEAVNFPAASSAVNYPQIANSATGNDLEVAAVGSDTNISLQLTPKGTGDVKLGTMTFDADQAIGAGQDNYVLTYDHSTQKILLEAASGGSSLTQEQVEDFAGSMIATGGTKTRITVTYQDATNDMDFVVDGDLANYDNTNTAFITGSSTDTLTNKTIDSSNNTVSIAASRVTSGTLADARIAQSNVTQHEGALDVLNMLNAPAEANADVTDTANVTAAGALMDSEVTNLAAVKAFDPADYAAASHFHTASGINSGTFADARIAESNVTQHQAALSITESQISDLGNYAGLGANIFTGTQDFNGQQVEGMRNKVVTGVSGTLTMADHSGNILVTSGNVTIPTTAGFNCILRAGGAHTVTFNGQTSAAMASGDLMTLVVESGTVIHAVLTAAADKVAFT